MRAFRFVLSLLFALFAAPAFADPSGDLVQKLATYQRLLMPNGGSFAEISTFMAQNPDWPQQAMLANRREDALMEISDPTTLLGACHSVRLQEAGTLARCAAAEAGEPERAAQDARKAWARGYDDPNEARQFLAQFGGLLDGDSEWRRYTRLLAADSTLAARQLGRLSPEHVRLATVLLAFRKDDPNAASLAGGVPEAEQSDPTLFLTWSTALLRAQDDKGALALWQRLGAAAQGADPNRLGSFWNARSSLARQLIADNDAAGAYALVKDHGQTAPDKIADAEFLAGWIALRKLDAPAIAIEHFTTLANSSGAVITIGRAHYWLGRAYAAKGEDSSAQAEYLEAAQYPYSYYGQLAIKALHYSDADLAQKIADAHDPAVDTILANALAGTEMARAAQILVDQGNLPLARIFVAHLAATAVDPGSKVAAAYLANTLGLPDQALAIARQAAVQGVLLPDLGWPTPVTPPTLADFDPALTLAITRQESNFNADAVSSAGALGLMQLMPATARTLARKLKIRRLRISALTGDPTLNLELGSDYLQELMDRFDNVVPFAVAAYNAGPDRVDQWRGQMGDPTQAGGPDMIDWIEMIPFNETRNYVQRVIENLVIYRARAKRTEPHPLAPWLAS
jgi:soluble lytic murein transglycosylase